MYPERKRWLDSINTNIEAKIWVREFWDARDAYQFSKTRSCVGTERAIKRMNHATDMLIGMGYFPEEKHYPMPTLDELEGRVDYSYRGQ